MGAVFLLQLTHLPAPVGYVNDFANVIPAESKAHIQQLVDQVHAKSGGDIAIATLPDIGQRAPSDVALQLLREWKVGKAGNPGDPTRNTGVVVLVVPKETSPDRRGHLWISTGYGAEGFITDATAGQIREEALPYLRRGEYGAALELITLRLAQRYGGEFHFDVDTTALSGAAPARGSPSYRRVRSGGLSPFTLFVLFIVVLFVLNSFARRGRGGLGGLPLIIPGPGWGGREGGWGGGGDGGGFGGFGGGGVGGGGGAGGDW